MTISFSGLASGLDTSSWVEALVSVKKQEVTALETKLKGYQTTKTTLTDTRSAFSTLRSAIEKLTDAKFGGSFDLFGKILLHLLTKKYLRQQLQAVLQDKIMISKSSSLLLIQKLYLKMLQVQLLMTARNCLILV